MFKHTKTNLLLLVARKVAISFRFVLVLAVLASGILYTRAGAPDRAYAATASTLNFQARLLQSNGAIVADGTYNVEFKLYDASTGGAAIWTETRTGANKVTVKSGYLSVYLGDISTLPTAGWDQERFLTLNIGGTGTPTWDGEMSPRLRLTAVPYAFQAQRAEGLEKLVGSFTGILNFNATLGQNTTYTLPDPGQASVNICLSSGNCAGQGGSLAGTGTQGRIAYFDTANGNNLGDGWLFQDTGSSTLELDSSRNLALLGGNLSVTGNGDFTGNLTIGDAAGDTLTINGTAVSVPNGLNVDSNTFVIDALNNRVGIGDATPAAALTVGNGDLFQVNSSGAIAAATGITSSGTITFSALNSVGIVQTNGSGQLSTGAIDRNSATLFTGDLNVSNGGTGVGTFTSNGIVYGNGTGALQTTGAAANSVLITDGSNVPSLSQTLPTAVQGNITSTGVLGSGSIASGFGSIDVGADAISTTGTVSAGTLTVSGNATVSGTLGVTGLATFSGGLTVTNGDQFTNAGSSLFTAISIGNLPAGGDIGTAAATVDIATTFNVSQTTTAQTLTLPAPTDTTAGRIAYVVNVGTAEFIMYNVGVASGGAQTFIWNGAAWVPSNIDGAGTGITGTGQSGRVAYFNTSTTLTSSANFLFDGNDLTLGGDLALNGGDLTSTGALNITPGGALTVGVTSQTLTMQGSNTAISSTGAGNDITLTSADQIILNGGTTIELQDNTNITGDLDVSGGLTIGAGNAFTVNSSGAITAATGITTTGNFSQTGAGTFGTGTGAVSLNGATSVTGSNTFTVGTGLTTLGGGLTATGTTNINATGTAATVIGNTSATLTLNGSDVVLGSASVTRTAAGTTTFNLVDAANTTLAVTNTGTGNANLTVDGNGTFATGLTVSSGGASITGNSTITGTLSGLTGLTSSGTITFSGLTTDGVVTVTGGVLGSTSTLNVANGGTGAATLTANGILYGNGTSAIQATGAAANSVLVTDGSNVPSLSQTLPNAVQTNITATGALDAGSITANFGAIDVGADAITTTGTVSAGTLTVSGNATVGGTLGVTGLATFSGGLTVVNGQQFTNAGSTLFTAVSLGNLTSGPIGTAAATVDTATTFNIAQTTASQTFTIPSPTDTTAGRIVYINNIGNTSFMMYGITITAGRAQGFIWTGTAWTGAGIDSAGNGITGIGTIDGQSPKVADGAQIFNNNLYLQTADASFPGLVSTGAQTFAGAKTFGGQITANGGISLGTQTLQGTTAIIDFTNFDVAANGNTDVAGTFTSGTGNAFTINAAGAITAATGITSSGTITFSGLGTGLVTANGTGVLNSGTVDRNSASYFTGTLNVSGGGTGAATLTSNGILFGNGTGAIQATTATANSVLVTDGTNAPSLSQTLPTAVQGNITSVGTLTSGSIASGFGTISTANNITTTATLSGGTLTVTNNATIGGDVTVSGGQLTVGTASGQAGSIILYDGGSAGSENTLTIDVESTLGQNTVITFPDPGGATAEVCYRNDNNCGFALTSGSGNYVQFTPNAAQIDNNAFASIFINDTGGGNLLHLQSGGTDRFIVENDGDVTVSGDLAVNGGDITSATSLNVTASNGALTFTSTGATSDIILNSGRNIELQDNTNITGNLDVSGSLTAGTANAFNVNGSGAITAATGIVSSGTIQFSGLSTGVVTANGTGVIASGTLDRNSSTYFTGTLSVANGGTGATTFNTNGVVYYNGTTQVSTTAGANSVLITNGSNVPSLSQTLPSAVQANITQTGALNAGSITSGFGAIDTGADNIQTTGTVQGGIVNAITGFQVNGTAATGNYLRGNGTNFVSSALLASDLSGTIFSSAADTGTDTFVTGDTISVQGGTNGIDTSLTGDTFTLNLDYTEIGDATFGDNSDASMVWTFDPSGVTNPSLTFANDSLTIDANDVNINGTLAVGGPGSNTVALYGDLIVNRGVSNRGAIYFGNTNGLNYLYFNGTDFEITDSLAITGSITTTSNADFEGTLTAGTGNAFQVNASGQLIAGSIASGFGSIDVGADAITTTGTLSGGTLNVSGNATVGGTFSADGNTTIGDANTDTLTINAVLQGGSPLVFEGAAADANELTLSIASLTADRTITLPDESGTVCLQNSTNCGFALASGSGSYVQFAPASAQSDASANASIFINDTGGGNLLHLQVGGSDRFVVDTSGNLVIAGDLRVNGNDIQDSAGTTRISLGATNAITGSLTATGNADFEGTLTAGTSNAFQVSTSGAVTAVGVNSGTGLIQGTGGLTVTGTTNINATGSAATNIGNTGSVLTLTGIGINLNTSLLNRVAAGTTTLNLNDAANTTFAIANTGTGVANLTVDGNIDVAGTFTVGTGDAFQVNASGQLIAGSITSGFGAIDTGADNIQTTGTVQGGIVNATTGFRVNGAATAGEYLRGNGTNFVSSALLASDLSGTIFNTSADTGTGTVVYNDTFSIQGGTNGIDTSLTGDAFTLNLDTTEISTATFGSGADFTWTFNGSGVTDPSFSFGNNALTVTAATTTLSGDLRVNGNDIQDSAGATRITLGATNTITGNLSVTANLTVDGNTTLGNTAGDTLTITGTAVSIPNSLNFDSNTLYIDAGNNRVGIGTASPGEMFHIINTANAISAIETTSGTGAYALQAFKTPSRQYRIGVATSSETLFGLADKFFLFDSTANVPRFVVDTNGNMGLGDVSPDAKLEVLATTEQLRLTHTDGTADSRFTVDASGNLTIDNTGTKMVVADDLQVSGNDILDSAGTSRITLGATNTLTGNIDVTGGITAGTNNAFSVSTTGVTNIAITDAGALRVQNTSGADTLFTVDTSARGVGGGNRIKIGNDSGLDTDVTILQVDSTTADITSNLSALNGGLYYNSTDNTIKAIINGAVDELCFSSLGNCAGSGTSVTQSGTNANGQVAYFTSGNNITSSTNFLFDGTNVDVGGSLTVGTANAAVIAANGDITTAGDIAVNGGDITSTGALNITPGGALTVGVATQTTTIQGTATTITSNGAGNDITVTSADQVLISAGSTIELQSNANVTGDFTVSGSTTLGDAAGDTLTINGTAVSIPNNLNFDSNTFFIDAANNRVGIGTTTPSANLSFGSDVTAQKILLYESGTARYGFGIAPNEMRIFAPTAGAHVSIGSISNADGSTWSEKLRIETGNLDVTGEAGLQGTFTVDGTTAAATYYGSRLSVTNNQTVNANTLYGQYVSFTDAGTLANTVTGLYVDAATANPNDTTYSAIFQGGNVGIGDATPDALLDVAGSFQFDGSGIFGDDASDTLTINGTAVSVPNNLNIDSNTLFVDAANNSVGVGTTSLGGAKLAVQGSGLFRVGGTGGSVSVGAPAGASGISISNTNRSDIRYDDAALYLLAGVGASAPANTSGIVILNGGNVGVGDASPIATFTVGDGDLFQVAGATGNITTAGTLAVNGDSITSDGATLTINAGGAVDIQDAVTADSLTLDTGALTFTNGVATDITTTGNDNLTVEAAGTGFIDLNDTVRIGTLAAADTDSYAICRDASSGQLSACDANTTGRPFLQGGNSFGATAVLGTNDANALDLETSGVTRLTVQADGDVAFDTETLFVDAANNRVGIGTATPAATLDIKPTGGASFTNGLQLSNGAGGNSWLLQAGSPSVNNNFFTLSDLTSGNVVRFTIDDTGKVGIGTVAPSADLSFGFGANRTINVITQATNIAGNALTLKAGNGGAGASAVVGGTLTLEGGNAAGTGNASGGSVSIQGGAPVGTGAYGDINLQTTGGNVGIGATANTYKLYVNAGAGGGLNVTGGNYSVFAADTTNNAYGYFRSVNTSDSVSRFEIGAYDISGASQGGRDLILNGLGGNVAVGVENTPAYLFTVGANDATGIDASGNVIIKGAGAAATADLSFGAGANRTINVLTQTAANTAGNNLTLQSGTGNGTGGGGTLQLTAGTGGATAGAGGDVVIQGGAAGAGSTTAGSVIFRSNGNNKTTAVLIQNSASTNLLVADTTNMVIKIASGAEALSSTLANVRLITDNAAVTNTLRVGSAADNINFGETVAGKLRFVGNARNSRQVLFSPEFQGATLSGTGVGVMTSDFCSNSSPVVNTGVCAAANERHNYYNWTATSATNAYSIYVKWRVPSDFSALDLSSSTPIQFYGTRSSSSAGTSVTLTLRDSTTGTICGTGTAITNTTAWSVTTYSHGSCSLTRNQEMIWQIDLSVGVANESARIGEIYFNYLADF